MKRTARVFMAVPAMLALFFTLPFLAAGATPAFSLEAADSGAPNTYTVSYNTNGGVFTGGAANHAQSGLPEGSWVNIIEDTPAVEGNYFAGWLSSADGQTYQPGDGFAITADTTLWATWAAIPMCTISLHFNTEDDFVSTGQFLEGHVFDLAPYTISRAGHHFLGWSADPAATAAEYPPGSALPLYGNTDVYAMWEPLADTAAPVDSSQPESRPAESSSSRPRPDSSSEVSRPASDTKDDDTDASGVWKWLFILLIVAGAVAVVGIVITGRMSRRKNETKPAEKVKDEGQEDDQADTP